MFKGVEGKLKPWKCFSICEQQKSDHTKTWVGSSLESVQ